jgi:ribosomal protein S18 acetylase RimI-like enzyme
MPAVTTRPVDSADLPFLIDLFATSGDVPAWLSAADPQLLRIQFTAQQAGYGSQFPGASHEIILVEGERAGQVRWKELADEIRIIDVSLLPRFRRHGAASSVYRTILGHAQARGKPACASVARLNHVSLAFHQRLGFTVTGSTETHFLLTAKL